LKTCEGIFFFLSRITKYGSKIPTGSRNVCSKGEKLKEIEINLERGRDTFEPVKLEVLAVKANF
jgi:hypothetical protein